MEGEERERERERERSGRNLIKKTLFHVLYNLYSRISFDWESLHIQVKRKIRMDKLYDLPDLKIDLSVYVPLPFALDFSIFKFNPDTGLTTIFLSNLTSLRITLIKLLMSYIQSRDSSIGELQNILKSVH